MRAWLLALALLVAGCVAPAGTVSPPPAPGEGSLSLALAPIEVQECTMVIAFFPIPLEDAQARVPEGFTPVPFSASGSGYAQAGVWVWTCSAVNGAEGGWADAWTALLVTPPSSWAAEGAAFHAVLLEGVNDREDMVAHYAAWNVTIGHGPVSLVQAGAPGTLVTGKAALPGGPLTLEMRGTPTQGGDAGVVRGFAVADGKVTGAFEYIWTPYEFSTGAMTLAEGARVFGSQDPLVGTGGFEHGPGYGFVLQPVVLPPLA